MHDSLRTFLPQITLLVMACLWITGCSKKTEPGPAPKAPLVVGQPAGDVPLNQPAQQPEDDLDRKAAAWVVKLGGSVRISANGIITEYPKDGELPERGFQLIAVNFI
ncbi:MAG: hypothetical protein Q8K78_10925, partial [Planctomycetaceae bacterium]|nr:hypothetical protein [Planctomycetaceae bacterium]